MTINELRLSIRQTLLTINNEDDESIHNILDLFLDVLNDKQLKQIEEKPVFLDCEEVDADEYQDYYIEQKVIKSNTNDRKRNRKTIENSG